MRRIAAVLKCGDKITILTEGDSNHWYHVRTQDGRQGYVSSSFISSGPIQRPEEAPTTKPSGGGTLPDKVYKPVGKLRPYSSQSQQSPAPSAGKLRPDQLAQSEDIQKLITTQTKMIGDLAQHVQELEEQVRTLEQRQREASSVASRNPVKPDFSEVRVDLAGFRSKCTSEQDRAVAMALSEGLSVHTYEGAAAMNCAGRVEKIVSDLVDSLERRY
jgi:SH3 domain-containing protein